MPTPHGPRGGMAFSADELRVLRRALAIALQPTTVPALLGPDRAEEVQDCLRLAQAVDAAVHEGGRLRAFLLDELARYRDALPGAALGYLARLRSALAAGYVPRAEDLIALRAICASPAGTAETARRRALLRRCEWLAEQQVRAKLARHTAETVPAGELPLHPDDEDTVRPGPPAGRALPPVVRGAGPATAPHPAPGAGPQGPGPIRRGRGAGGRGGLLALPGGRASRPGPRGGGHGPRGEHDPQGPHGPLAATDQPGPPQNVPKPEPRKKPATPERGEPGRRGAPTPGRPVPTPAEVFPPKRKPARPSEGRLPFAGPLTARSA